MVSTATRPGRVVLLRTAIGLMGEKGYEGTTTRDIAHAAGVSVAALYYHFPSKLDLLREFLVEAHAVVVARLERRVEAAGPDPRDRLDAVVATLIASNLHDEWAQRAAQVAWREYGRLNDGDRRTIVAKRNDTVALIERIVAEGVAAGAFTTTNTTETARAILVLCMSVMELYADMDMTMEAVIELYQGFATSLACPSSR